ncbi:MAG: hypothetical protein HQK64_08270 [Desulfamplus sp.]|nr:hypothetical protein [Desulfamplus sp.]
MKSRRNEDLSSFELLLDTMCNTFGGIVFIALLLTLLSQYIEIDTKSDSYPLTHQKSITPNRALKKLEEVKLSISLQDRQEELKNQIQEDFNRIESAKKDIQHLEQEVDRLTQKVTESEKAELRTLRVPKLHKIDKSPIFIAIKGGRFYTITNISYAITEISSKEWGSSARGYDRSDIFIREQSGRVDIEPLSAKGQIIEKGAENIGKLQQAILNINPTKEFINFAVYPDSFDEFNYVKEIFIKRGFDYNWFIINDKLSLVKGSGESHAQ